ncbi:meteorin-like protein [Lithobates pipiens]
MKRSGLLDLLQICILLLSRGIVFIAGDFCSWKGSGLTWDFRSRAVKQIHLRCAEGSLEWLYPTRALRVILEPSLVNSRHTNVCIKPFLEFRGANMYIEENEELHLLVSEASEVQRIYCFGMDVTQRVSFFLQSSPQKDLSRRKAGFQYEVMSNQHSGPLLQKFASADNVCRPCDSKDLLMAICKNDYVVSGSIESVSHDVVAYISKVHIKAIKVYRQQNSIFQHHESADTWTRPIRTLLKCGVKKGKGDFLFTGNEHFGDAWLGCAPRLKDFLEIYQNAKHLQNNPCEFQM